MKIWILMAFGVVILVASIVANVRDNEDCRARGGVVHCATSNGYVWTGLHSGPTTRTTCDCYWPDGRVMVR
jgi:hypothetical protein